MANTSKPLNPMAPPYQKKSTILSCTHLPHHHILFVSYDVHRLQPPRKSFTLHPPVPRSFNNVSKQKKKKNKYYSPLTPVPSGPRASTKVWMPVVRGGGDGGRKRWKNKRCGYHQILQMESETTSVIIKNIPYQYTRELLIRILDNHCKKENEKMKNKEDVSAYDYLYLPIDFTNGVNAGFGFVNFTNSKAAFKFRDTFDGKLWERSNSRKVARIFRARIQGKEALMKNWGRMDMSNGTEEALPVVFEPARDGSGRVNCQMVKLGQFLH